MIELNLNKFALSKAKPSKNNNQPAGKIRNTKASITRKAWKNTKIK